MFIRIAASTSIAATLSLSAASSSAPPSQLARAPEVRLTSTEVTLPFTMVRSYPFVEGSVQGVRGKFMLDTGLRDALVLNDHRVPLKGGLKIGSGFFGSGQTFDLRLNEVVRDVQVASLRYPSVSRVKSQDARQLERITPDFIGWFGFEAFAGRAMKLDYVRRRATFYSGGAADFLRREKVLGTITLETRRLPNIPLAAVRIGVSDLIATFDTGDPGSLYLNPATRQALLKGGHLVPTGDPDVFDVRNVTIGGVRVPDLAGVEVHEAPSPAAKPVGVIESSELVLGYSFLRQFKTVWDFRGKRMHLLER